MASQTRGHFDETAAQAIGLERDGRLVAGTIFENWNGRSAVCHTAIRGRLTAYYLWVIADYAFRQLKVRKLIAPINTGNAKMMRLAPKMGFRPEARISGAGADGDDVILFTMKWKDCRFLKGSYLGKTRPASTGA